MNADSEIGLGTGGVSCAWDRRLNFDSASSSIHHVRENQFFLQTRTKIFYEHGQGPKLSPDDFMQLFAKGGSLDCFNNNIVAFQSFARGTLNVTFKKIDQNVLDLENELMDGKQLKTAKNVQVFVKIGNPWRPVTQIALRGVPIEYNLAQLKADVLTMGWGEPIGVISGYHKHPWSHMRNNWVFVKLINVNEGNIPRVFNLMGHDIYVRKPGESSRPWCNYCEKYWHVEETCRVKRYDLREKQRIENERLEQ